MVSALYVGSIALVLSGLLLGIYAHVSGWSYGTVFGPLLLVAGIGVGMVAGGVTTPWAFLGLLALAGLLIAVDHWNVYGLAAYGLTVLPYGKKVHA